MIILISISILLLAIAAFYLSKLNRPRSSTKKFSVTESRQFDGLFTEQHAAETRLLEQAEAIRRAEDERERLLRRAARGEVSALRDAHEKSDSELYHDVLQRLVARTGGKTALLRSIAQYIVDSGKLRSTSEFAQTMIEQLSRSLDRQSLTDMICLAALSDDAATFQNAVDLSLKQWRAGKLPQVSAKDLLNITESAYWLIAAEVRCSGSGFLLKQAIANVRRELAAANRQSA
jgi:hypothetical protein